MLIGIFLSDFYFFLFIFQFWSFLIFKTRYVVFYKFLNVNGNFYYFYTRNEKTKNSEDLIPKISLNGFKTGKTVRKKLSPLQNNNNSIAYKDMNGSQNGQKISQNGSLNHDFLQSNGKIHTNGTSNASSLTTTNDYVTSTCNASSNLLLKSCGKSLR